MQDLISGSYQCAYCGEENEISGSAGRIDRNFVFLSAICTLVGTRYEVLHRVQKRLLNEFHYILLNKPYGTLCQFTGNDDRETLAWYGPFPTDVYPAGRLDADSEGLILLTNDGRLKHKLLDPKFRH